ncbi:UDP-2,4-diacetamido-2,4,6-trideoxy-beta-L-altropyranose hydrolase [Phenylobacterium sp.]|uniref:UDP-2,4-diacetamido-2,4, 6-trideoxy-beta-L-altropyranose hydrolase n=1 Tax=Phenylobacterium sp. TaxID=1871053 RepID=UPI00344F9308
MTGPRILFVVDAGPEVGGGHVMRSLTLARALQAQGAQCGFAGPPATAEILDAFAPDMARRVAADPTAAAAREAFDAIVFDHYGLSEPDHSAVAKGCPTLVIDDLADRAIGGDIVLDSGPARRAEDYLGLAPETARLLLGPQFAPIRPEFAALRAATLAHRGGPVRRILVAMGLTDVGGITARIVERMRPRIQDVALDIVLGAGAASLAGLARVARRDERISLHVDTPDMAALTADADIAVGAPGSSTWERCVLGLPSLLVALADNQRPAARTLAERGVALVVDIDEPEFDAAFDRALSRLLRDGDLRADLSRASAEVCDGEGAARTAEAFLKLIAGREA